MKCFKLGLTARIPAHLGEKTMWFRKKSLYSRQILYHRCDATLIAAWSRVRVLTRPLARQGSPLSALCRACHVDGGKPRLEIAKQSRGWSCVPGVRWGTLFYRATQYGAVCFGRRYQTPRGRQARQNQRQSKRRTGTVIPIHEVRRPNS